VTTSSTDARPVGTRPPAAPDKAHLAAVVRGGALNLAGAAVNALVSVLLVVVVARGLDRTSTGAFWSAVALFVILETVARGGAETAMVYFLPRYRTLARHADVPVLLRVALVRVLVFAGLVGAALFALAPWTARVVIGVDDGEVVGFLRLLAAALPLVAVYRILLAVTRGYGTMRPTVYVEKIGVSLVQPVLIVAVLAAGGGLLLVGAGWLAPSLVGLALAWLIVRRRLSADARLRRGTPSPAGTTRREFWTYTWPRALASLCQVVFLRIDVVLVSALRSPAEAAVYVGATRFLVLGQLGVLAVQQAMSPKISELLARDDRDRAYDLYQTSTAWLVALSWPVYLLLAVFGGSLLGLLGSDYAEGADVVTLLAVGMLFAAAAGPVDVLLLMAGRSGRSLANRLLALAVMIGLDVLLIPRFGVSGAAVAWAIGMVVANTAALIQVRSLLGMQPLGAGTRRTVLLALLAFGGWPLAVRLVLGTGVPAFLLAAVVGTGAYLAGLWWARGVLHLELLRALRRRPGRPPEPAGAVRSQG
jgi:O-antigen/teichoic acid export membrane protein